MAGFTLGALSLILAGVGTGAKIIGDKKATNAAAKGDLEVGAAERRAKDSEAQLADYNAAVADLQAQDAVARGREQENRFRKGVNGMIGAQRAGIAAGNIDVGYGSAVDVQADAAFLGELDALQIRTNAARESWGYQVEAVDSRTRADIARREGANLEAAGAASAKAKRKARTIGAVTTAFGAGASLLESRYGFGKR